MMYNGKSYYTQTHIQDSRSGGGGGEKEARKAGEILRNDLAYIIIRSWADPQAFPSLLF